MTEAQERRQLWMSIVLAGSGALLMWINSLLLSQTLPFLVAVCALNLGALLSQPNRFAHYEHTDFFRQIHRWVWIMLAVGVTPIILGTLQIAIKFTMQKMGWWS